MNIPSNHSPLQCECCRVQVRQVQNETDYFNTLEEDQFEDQYNKQYEDELVDFFEDAGED